MRLHTASFNSQDAASAKNDADKSHQKGTDMQFSKLSRLFLACILLITVTSYALERKNPVVLRAHAASGTNRFLGQPISDFSFGFGTAGFSNVGVFNASGNQPLPLDSQAFSSSILATSVDPGFLALFGKTSADVNPNLVNVPLRSVAVNADLAGVNRVSTVGIGSAAQTQPSQAEPARTVTLGDWVRARGSAAIECENHAAIVQLEFSGLLPNRIYSVWGIFGGPSGLFPFPLGGVPNIFVTDRSGRASFERQLNFCPQRTAANESPLLAIDVVFHSDNQIYGLVPEPDLAGFFTGTVTNTQLEFLVNGRELQ
jgi:hypothetical protein